MNLYQKVKQRCADVGMSISELERECGFPRGSVAKWDVNIPSIEKVKKVADALNTSIDILIEGEESTA